VMNFWRGVAASLVVAIMGAIMLAGFGVAAERGRGAEALIAAGMAAGDAANVFRWVFAAAAAFLVIGFVALIRLPERPLRGAPAGEARHRARSPACVLLAPVEPRLENRAQRASLVGQHVVGARRMLGVKPPLDDAVLLERLQPRRQRVRADAYERLLEILEAA